jgi:hypothetical protein
MSDGGSIRLSCEAAAKLIGVSPRTLERWRRDRVGPPFFHPRPGRPFYTVGDVIRWIERGSVATFSKGTRESPRFPAVSSETIESSLTDTNAEDDAP